MTKSEWETFEKSLLDRGYKKWVRACYGEEDFDVGYSVDFVVMPCIDGRMDVIFSVMSNDLDNDVEFAEQFAKDYYEFVIKHIKI